MPSTAPAADTAAHQRRGRWVVGACLTLAGCSSLGSLFAPYLAVNHPTGLLVLSPLYRHLVLIAPQLDVHTFVGLGVMRRLTSALAFFGLGYFHGPTAIAWAERRSTLATRWIRWADRLFRRVGPLLVLWPSLTLWLLAGASRMSVSLFAALSAVGIGCTMLAVWLLGDQLSEPIGMLLAFLRENLIEASVAVMIVFAVVHGLRTRRMRGGRSVEKTVT